MQERRIIYRGGQARIEEKKSKFIATVQPVDSEEAASVFIASMKKKYWDASHNCSAFVIGENRQLQRCSDDGEPAGTAGRPMLEVLLGNKLTDVVVVVTRYFGGTLLGTGGLVRAYQKAVLEGLKASALLDVKQGSRILLRTDYQDYGKIQYLLGTENIPVLNTSFTDVVEVELLTEEDRVEQVKDAITQATSARAKVQKEEKVRFGMDGNKPVFL